jgi:hypothetical protein
VVTTDALLHISAVDVMGTGPEDALHASEFEGVQVSFPAEDGHEPRCRHCHEVIEEGTVERCETAPEIPCPTCDGADESCPTCDGDGEVSGPHEPETGPGTWCNSAAVTVDESEDSVTVSISVGDPRGAFTMTVTKVDRSGYCKHCNEPIKRRSDGKFMHPGGGNHRECFHVKGNRFAEPDGERMLLHVPYEGQGWLHMLLTKLNDGTYLVGH